MTILFSAAASYFIILWNCNNFNITLWSNTAHVWGRFQGHKGLTKIWLILKHKVHISLWFWYTINPLFIKFMLLLLLSRFSHVQLCNPREGSPPGSPVPGILQARTLGWVGISFSNAWKWKVKVKSLSSVQLFTTPWTAAYQAPPSMGFSRQSSGVGCHCLLPLSA